MTVWKIKNDIKCSSKDYSVGAIFCPNCGTETMLVDDENGEIYF